MLLLVIVALIRITGLVFVGLVVITERLFDPFPGELVRAVDAFGADLSRTATLCPAHAAT